ncbi:MAG TPA: cytochrome c oxidase subunit II [Blastocatellia bacterium]
MINCPNKISRWTAISFAAILLALGAETARAQLAPLPAGVQKSGLPGPLQNIGIDQKLGDQVPMDLVFRDEAGDPVKLGQLFSDKPVILSLVYYDCPMLCTQVLNGLDRGINVLTFDLGKEFDIVTVSFNPKETPQLANAKKQEYLKIYRRPGASAGWHFLTGEQSQIDALANSVGFKYALDPKTGLYAHASGLMVLTPAGKISRYFYGIDYAPHDLKLALMEASKNKIGSPIDKVLLYCYQYDPATGKYSLMILRIIRIAGGATVAGILLIMFFAGRKGKKRREQIPIGNFAAAFLPFFPPSASTHASKVDALFIFLIVIAIFFSVLIFALIIYFAVRYRRRSEDEVGLKVIPDMKLELAWIVIPFILCMAIFVWGADVYFNLSEPPRDSMEIFVVAKQWMWKFQHMDGQREIDELHVPVGRDIKLTMTTEDVIHSFFVPAFRIKADVVPGRYSSTWFHATQPGKYHLFCAEYCGTNHSGMGGWVYVMEPADYEAWLSGGATEGSLASNGQKLFQQLGCSTCHLSNGQGRGPRLEGIYGKPVLLNNGETLTVDDNYLRTCILDPKANVPAGFQPIMPTFQGIVNEEQLLELVAYIRSLGAGEGAGPQAPAAAPGAGRNSR